MQWLNPRRSFENGRGLNCCTGYDKMKKAMGYDKMKKAIDKQVKLMYNNTCATKRCSDIIYNW